MPQVCQLMRIAAAQLQRSCSRGKHGPYSSKLPLTRAESRPSYAQVVAAGFRTADAWRQNVAVAAARTMPTAELRSRIR